MFLFRGAVSFYGQQKSPAEWQGFLRLGLDGVVVPGQGGPGQVGQGDAVQIVPDHLVQPPPHGIGAALGQPAAGGRPRFQAGDGGQVPFGQQQDVADPVLVGRAGQPIAAPLAPQALQQAVDKGTVSSDADAVRAVSSFIARQVAQTFLFMVAFVLILVLWFFLSHALDLAFRLPVLSTLNRWSGAALGVVRGAILLLIICWLLKGGLLSQDAIQNTYLLRLFCTFNPLTLLS